MVFRICASRPEGSFATVATHPVAVPSCLSSVRRTNHMITRLCSSPRKVVVPHWLRHHIRSVAPSGSEHCEEPLLACITLLRTPTLATVTSSAFLHCARRLGSLAQISRVYIDFVLPNFLYCFSALSVPPKRPLPFRILCWLSNSFAFWLRYATWTPYFDIDHADTAADQV